MFNIKELTRPFDDADVYFAPKQISNDKTRANVYPYLKTPSLINRLNSVLGPLGWQWDVEPMEDGSIKGTLSLWMEDIGWISKAGIGSPMRYTGLTPESFVVDAKDLIEVMQPLEHSDRKKMIQVLRSAFEGLGPESDSLKSAETDAFKRAAMKFGIGIEMWTDWQSAWVSYDGYKIRASHEEMVKICRRNQSEPAAPTTPAIGDTEFITDDELNNSLKDMI